MLKRAHHGLARWATWACFALSSTWFNPVCALEPLSHAFPSRSLRWFVPGPPGSPTDLAARLVAERMASAFGQPVIVENRPGAGGTIALAAVGKAAPDGHTIGLIGVNHVVAAALMTQSPYDLLKDFAPVTEMLVSATILVVPRSSAFTSVADIVTAAKSNPGSITYSSGGNATPTHLAAELLGLHAGIRLHHVPYQGPPAAATAVLGSQVHMAFIGAAAVVPHVKSGAVRALATPAPERLAAFPDLPTMRELGYAAFAMRDWVGVAAPSGTPAKSIARLSVAIASALDSPDLRERLASLGMTPAPKPGPEEFNALIRSELPRWARVIREADIRIQ